MSADCGDGPSARTFSGVKSGTPVKGWATVGKGGSGGAGCDVKKVVGELETQLAVGAALPMGPVLAPTLSVEPTVAVANAPLMEAYSNTRLSGRYRWGVGHPQPPWVQRGGGSRPKTTLGMDEHGDRGDNLRGRGSTAR